MISNNPLSAPCNEVMEGRQTRGLISANVYTFHIEITIHSILILINIPFVVPIENSTSATIVHISIELVEYLNDYWAQRLYGLS